MKKEDVLAWKQGFVNAKDVERLLTQKDILDTDRSIRLALELIDTCRNQGVWIKAGRDMIWDEEVNEVRKRWVKLREEMINDRKRP